MISSILDWLPFACLVTGSAVRKPMMTKIIEGLLIGILSGVISGAAGLYVGVKLLERDIQYERLRFQEHVVDEREARVKIDSAILRVREAGIRDVNEIISRLTRIEDCIRMRTCTK